MGTLHKFKINAISGSKDKDADAFVSTADCLTEKVDSFCALTKIFGFQDYAVIDIHERKSDRVLPVISFHSLGDAFIKNMHLVDDLSNCSIFLSLITSNLPFTWETGKDCRTQEKPHPSLNDAKFDKLLNLAGIHSGCCIPVYSPLARRSLIMYFSSDLQQDIDLSNIALQSAECFQNMWYQNVNVQKAAIPALNFTEIDCIKELAAGNSIIEISRNLQFSEHTIHAYIATLMSKLEVKSTNQLIIKMASLGWLQEF